MKKIIRRAAAYIIGFAMVGSIAWLDHGTQATMSFYLLFFPFIMLVAWFGGRVAGIIMSLLCVGAWIFSAWSALSAIPVSIRIWSVATHISAMLFVALMTVALSQSKRRRNVDQKKQGEKLGVEMDLARRDYLTGALNSRGFHEKFTEERAKIYRYGRPASLLHLDLDHFKEINDVQGHQVGDDMLRRVVSIINDNVRHNVDFVARMGGDEFVVLLPETQSNRAKTCALRILGQIKETLQGPLTGSIGIVSFEEVSNTNLEISKMADDAMYRAKSLGRDRVVIKNLRRAPEKPLTGIGTL